MSFRDLNANLKEVHGISAQVVNTGGGAVNSGGVDLQGFGGAVCVFNIGANGGDTLNGTNFLTVSIQHADDDGTGAAGAYGDVAVADIKGATAASNIVITIDAAAEDELSYMFGYVGAKRFIKVTVTPNGTLTNGNPLSVNIIKGYPTSAPSS